MEEYTVLLSETFQLNWNPIEFNAWKSAGRWPNKLTA